MKRAIVPIVLFLVITELVDGHALLTLPPSKNGGTLSIPHASATDHFALASFGIIDKAFFNGDHSETPWTKPGEFDYKLAADLISGHPQTLHPCGCNAGDVVQCAGVVHATGFGETTLGMKVTPPTWSKGSVQETAWNAWANHGGGHIYMLCKKTSFDACRNAYLPSNPAQATQGQKDNYLTCIWACFESNTLDWAPTEDGTWSQKVQFQDDHCTYAAMDPMTKVGKDDHVWRYTPIPDSLQVTNGGEGRCMWDSVTDFSSPKAKDEFIASFGTSDICDAGLNAHTPSDWHVFDKVVIPNNLEEGEYLLSWRWDAYTADQMWTNCADVTIASSAASAGIGTSSNSDQKTNCTNAPKPKPEPEPKREPEPEPEPKPEPVPSSPAPMPVANKPTCPSRYTGLRPHDHCTRYYHCVHGAVTGNVQNCPPGTLFDVSFQYCNWANQVTCEQVLISATPPQPIPISLHSPLQPILPVPRPSSPNNAVRRLRNGHTKSVAFFQQHTKRTRTDVTEEKSNVKADTIDMHVEL